MEGDVAEDPKPVPTTAGATLRAAREALGLDLSEIASRTRIPQRHLEAIEQGNHRALPSVTYAMGFAKAYARAVGVDEALIGREVRAELGDAPERTALVPVYETNDPSRVPPRGLAIFGVVVALLVLIGVGIWYGTDWFRGNATHAQDIAAADAPAAGPDNATATAPTPAPVTGGQVTLVAKDTVWVRVTDAGGKRLFEKEMAPGERYDVPLDADHPRARTGRPDNLQVLVNGTDVPPLGAGDETVSVEVSAAALQARGQAPAAAPSRSAAADRPSGTGRSVTSGPQPAADPVASGAASPGNTAGAL